MVADAVVAAVTKTISHTTSAKMAPTHSSPLYTKTTIFIDILTTTIATFVLLFTVADIHLIKNPLPSRLAIIAANPCQLFPTAILSRPIHFQRISPSAVPIDAATLISLTFTNILTFLLLIATIAKRDFSSFSDISFLSFFFFCSFISSLFKFSLIVSFCFLSLLFTSFPFLLLSFFHSLHLLRLDNLSLFSLSLSSLSLS
ncbi:unnamed protein product [Acanthosepion pharaonis]|uniref:Uncharacterized protein n=1 Tax=Acanthosepion pharaonis TaxID=158019 RepID=A0A812DTL4_ACAPH|nr:unnamed protein product [Sepia pharaonis]